MTPLAVAGPECQFYHPGRARSREGYESGGRQYCLDRTVESLSRNGLSRQEFGVVDDGSLRQVQPAGVGCSQELVVVAAALPDPVSAAVNRRRRHEHSGSSPDGVQSMPLTRRFLDGRIPAADELAVRGPEDPAELPVGFADRKQDAVAGLVQGVQQGKGWRLEIDAEVGSECGRLARRDGLGPGQAMGGDALAGVCKVRGCQCCPDLAVP